MELQLSPPLDALTLALAALAAAVQATGYVVLRTVLQALRPTPPALASVAATVLAAALVAAANGAWTELATPDTRVGAGATTALVLALALLALSRQPPWRVTLADPHQAADLGVVVAPKVVSLALVALGLALAGNGLAGDAASGSAWMPVVAALALPAGWAIAVASLAAALDLAAVVLFTTPAGLAGLGAVFAAVAAAAALTPPPLTESGEPSPR